MSDCKTCDYGPENIDWDNLSMTAVGKIVGCHRESVARHVRHTGGEPWLTLGGPSSGAGSAEVPGTWIPRRRWDKPDGSVGYSYQFEPEVDIEMLSYDSLKNVFDNFDYSPKNLRAERGGTEILVDADKQLGKADELGGGTRETILRVQSSVKNAIERYARLRPQELYYIDGGDPIENCFNTPKQMAGNDMPPNEQVLVATRLVMENIKALLPYTDKLVYVAVPSNHGEVRTAMGTMPFNSDADWGLTIMEFVKDRCEEAGLPVEFIRPDPLEETATFITADGTRVAVNHGHQAANGKIDTLKNWVKGQDHGRRPGWDADIWILNHFHHPFHDSIGNGRHLLGTPSNDPGSLWVAKKTGESSKPGMLAITVHQGGWRNYSIL